MRLPDPMRRTLLSIAAAVGVALALAAGPRAQDRSFADWLAGVRAEAIQLGIKPAVVDEAIATVEPLPIVLERDRTQPEQLLTIDDYVARRLTNDVVRTARQMLQRQRRLLGRIASRYGVPAPVLVAVWGLESNFGRFSGVRPTIATLATLAFDDRRGRYFRRELFDAMRILDRGDIELARMKGSWAGAMGQPQFMPSSYLKFAVDFDGDGRRDIWTSQADVFASIANYLDAHGWTKGETWGREVRVPAGADAKLAAAPPLRGAGCEAARQMSEPVPLSEWSKMGVRTARGRKLPGQLLAASLVRGASRNFLVYRNYEALLAYNCAHAYALSVGLLADRIK